MHPAPLLLTSRTQANTYPPNLCTHLIFAKIEGYTEYSTIHEDVCVLTISGTAAAVRGLPDQGMAQRMWAEWEFQQAEIISGVEEHGRGERSRYPGGDSSPGSVISTNADTPFSAIDTPFSGAVSDDGGERGLDEPSVGADIVKGQLRLDGTVQPISFSNLTRKEIKDAKLKRNSQRLERRLRRMAGGKGARNGKRTNIVDASKESDIDKSNFISNVLLSARLARPCSYCHVPYHHRMAPFTNMKLV